MRSILLLFISVFLIFGNRAKCQEISYSFIVAGHGYGSHSGDNIGLHPPFLQALNNGFESSVQFFVFTGDVVNQSTEESWQQVANDLDTYGLPYYYSMGNHDNNTIGYEVFDDKFGNDYYAFDYNTDRFIILNSTEQDRSISSNQMDFLEAELERAGDIDNVFIFFHEVIWNSHEKYKGVLSNSRSRYDQMKDYSNYWNEVHPLLEEHSDKNIFVISGDVAGNPDAIPAFYDKWNHITLLSSGMGEVEDENYLLAKVFDDGNVEFELIALNTDDDIKDIEWYSVPETPQAIEGETSNLQKNTPYEYSVAEVYNADSYLWQMPENASGSSTGSSIEITYSDDFVSGNITVQASKIGFGSSDQFTQKVSLTTSVNHDRIENENIIITNKNGKVGVLCLMEEEVKIEVFTTTGAMVYSENTQLLPHYFHNIELNNYPKNLVLIRVSSKQGIFSKKLWME